MLQFQCTPAAGGAGVDMLCRADKDPLVFDDAALFNQLSADMANCYRPRFDAGGARLQPGPQPHRPQSACFVFGMEDDDDGKRVLQISITRDGDPASRNPIYHCDPLEYARYEAEAGTTPLTVTRIHDTQKVDIYVKTGLPISKPNLDKLCRSERGGDRWGVELRGEKKSFVNPVGVDQQTGSLIAQLVVRGKMLGKTLTGGPDALFRISPTALQNVDRLILNVNPKQSIAGRFILAEKVVAAHGEPVSVVMELDDKGRCCKFYKDGDHEYQEKLYAAQGFEESAIALVKPTSTLVPASNADDTNTSGSSAGVKKESGRNGGKGDFDEAETAEAMRRSLEDHQELWTLLKEQAPPASRSVQCERKDGAEQEYIREAPTQASDDTHSVVVDYKKKGSGDDDHTETVKVRLKSKPNGCVEGTVRKQEGGKLSVLDQYRLIANSMALKFYNKQKATRKVCITVNINEDHFGHDDVNADSVTDMFRAALTSLLQNDDDCTADIEMHLTVQRGTTVSETISKSAPVVVPAPR